MTARPARPRLARVVGFEVARLDAFDRKGVNRGAAGRGEVEAGVRIELAYVAAMAARSGVLDSREINDSAARIMRAVDRYRPRAVRIARDPASVTAARRDALGGAT